MRHLFTGFFYLSTRWATLPGQYGLSLNSFINQVPAEEGVETGEESVLYELDHQVWAQLRAAHPQLQQFLVATLEYTLCCFEDRALHSLPSKENTVYEHMTADCLIGKD